MAVCAVGLLSNRCGAAWPHGDWHDPTNVALVFSWMYPYVAGVYLVDFANRFRHRNVFYGDSVGAYSTMGRCTTLRNHASHIQYFQALTSNSAHEIGQVLDR